MDLRIIHIVEPDDVWQHFFRKHLESLGSTLRFHSSGSELLREVGDDSCMIAAEADLPDISWAELVRAVREERGFTRMPYVLMSTSVDRALLESGLAIGVQAVFHKQSMNPDEVTRFFAQYV